MDAREARVEINKRLTLNWLIQGAAQHAGMTAHHLVRDELDDIHPDLVRLYDLYALTNLFQYSSPGAVLLLGWPPHFSKRAASSPSHPFFNHPLLSHHGGTLAAAAMERAVERAKEKGLTGNPSFIPHRLSRELGRVRMIEAGHSDELIELAKQATSMVWGIPADRLDANLSATITLDDKGGAQTFRGRTLGMMAVGYERVAARDGAVDVVARATNWYFLAKELVKGTAEVICLHGLAHLGDDLYQTVTRHADRIEYEPWMLQSGGERSKPIAEHVAPSAHGLSIQRPLSKQSGRRSCPICVRMDAITHGTPGIGDKARRTPKAVSEANRARAGSNRHTRYCASPSGSASIPVSSTRSGCPSASTSNARNASPVVGGGTSTPRGNSIDWITLSVEDDTTRVVNCRCARSARRAMSTTPSGGPRLH
jgi:hypothetical protein